MEDVYISHNYFRKIGYKIFKKIGVQSEFYKPVVDGLIQTSLRGVDSHGIRLLPHYVRSVRIGRIKKNPRFSLKKTSETTIIMDADHGLGIAAGVEAMSTAVSLARKSGIGAVAVKNSTHFGAAALYSLIAAKKNMIGLSFTNSDSLVFPHGGKSAYLGTNPICFAAPVAGEEPFCLDMATSSVAWNRILIHKKKNAPLEKGWAADENGEECLNPGNAVGLLPLGGYKGYGLGLMVEILCSGLTGMPYGKHINPMYPLNDGRRYLSHFFLAIDIKKFQNLKVFKKRLKNIVDELRSIPVADGHERVMVSGDPEKLVYETRIKNGIPITEAIQKELIAIQKELKMNAISFK